MAFTLFAALCALVALLGAWYSWGSAGDAHLAANELRAMRAQVKAQEATIDTLGNQLQKLRGQFFAFKKQVEDEADGDGGEYADTLARIAPAEDQVCDNWKLARIEGPNSPAAKCECAYCNAQRQSRRAVRSALLPSTVAAQARMIEDVADGRE